MTNRLGRLSVARDRVGVLLVSVALVTTACTDSPGTRPSPTTPANPGATGPEPGVAANKLIIWGLTDNDVGAMTDAQLDEWKRRGVAGFVLGTQALRDMGGDQDFTSDPRADLSGANFRLQRLLRDTKFGERVTSRGMRVYFRFYAVNLLNRVTPLREWFDDAGWNNVVIPRVKDLAAAAKLLGFTGLGIDQELYPQTGNVASASWAWSYEGNTRSEQETRAKAEQRGQQLMTAITAVFPDVDVLAYNTSFPDSWEALVRDVAQNIKDAYVSSIQPDFWDGMAGVTGYSAIRFLDPIFYKITQLGGSTWDTALQYNANRIYAYLSRTWSSWPQSHSKVHVMPFMWLDSGNTSFEAARSPDYVHEQLQAFGKWSPGDEVAIYAYSFGTFDYGPYIPALQQAASAGKVDNEAPQLTITETKTTPQGLQLSGSATDNLAIRSVSWKRADGAEGVAALTWDQSGNYRSGWKWQMRWSIPSIPGTDPKGVTITVADIRGLTTTRSLT